MNNHYNQAAFTADWVSRRYEEMEEKAGIEKIDYPTHDMDGGRFVPCEEDWTDIDSQRGDDAYILSISNRLARFEALESDESFDCMCLAPDCPKCDPAA